jgi:hypothetical protein
MPKYIYLFYVSIITTIPVYNFSTTSILQDFSNCTHLYVHKCRGKQKANITTWHVIFARLWRAIRKPNVGEFYRCICPQRYLNGPWSESLTNALPHYTICSTVDFIVSLRVSYERSRQLHFWITLYNDVRRAIYYVTARKRNLETNLVLRNKCGRTYFPHIPCLCSTAPHFRATRVLPLHVRSQQCISSPLRVRA